MNAVIQQAQEVLEDIIRILPERFEARVSSVLEAIDVVNAVGARELADTFRVALPQGSEEQAIYAAHLACVAVCYQEEAHEPDKACSPASAALRKSREAARKAKALHDLGH